MKKIKLAIVAFIATIGSTDAQMGARIDQYYMDPSVIIPAAITNSESGFVSLYYNKLFTSVPGSPQHTLFNVGIPIPKKNMAFGLMYMKETIAFSELHNAYATYAYSIGLGGENRISLGASAGILSQNFDASKAIYYDNDDPRINALMFSPPVIRADLRASIFAKGENYKAGFSFSRLPKPQFDYSYYNYTAKYDLQSQSNLLFEYTIDLEDEFELKPSVNFGMYNWDYLYYQFNVSAYYMENFWVGVGMNNILQMGYNLGLKIYDDVEVSYSYNVPTGRQFGLLGPMHEFRTTIGFGALGNGKGNGSGSGSGDDSDDGDDGEGGSGKGGADGQGMTESARIFKPVTVKSLEDMEAFGKGNDSSGINLPPVPKVKPEPGFYLVAGLHSSEDKANNQIKALYMKDVFAYKIYDPRNKSFYVFLKHYITEKEANKGIFYFEASVPNVWVREVK